MSETYDKDFVYALLGKLDDLEKKQVSGDMVPLTAYNRPDDATTRILRAWLGFLETLYQHGVKAEHTINNVEIARLFALDLDTFRKLLNPLGLRGTHYTPQDRQIFASKVKMSAETLLLAHETEAMHMQPYHSVFATQPMHEKPWDNSK